jgi:starvation-inducible DNA-binding protein
MEEQYFSVVNNMSTGLPENTTVTGSHQVAEALSNLLVSTRALGRQSLYCHWQATDPDSMQLHSLFEQHYQSARKAMDIIFDRIHTLGYELPETFSKASWGTNDDDARPLEEMITSLIKSHQRCALEARKALSLAEMVGDDISANLASQRLMAHDKAALLLPTLIETPTQSAV